MIRLIYSYVKSAVVFSVMLAVNAAGAVGVCVFTESKADLAIRLTGLALFAVAVYVVSCVQALKSISDEIRLANDDCNVEKLNARLKKLIRRAAFGKVKASILLEYADTLIYLGKAKEAEAAVSDAIIAGKDSAKGDAAVCFCKIFFIANDREYFEKYYDKAIEKLNGRINAKSKNREASDCAAVLAAALQAMNLSFNGNVDSAVKKLDCISTLATNLQKKNTEALKNYILNVRDEIKRVNETNE